MKKTRTPDQLLAEARKQVREEIERESAHIAKPIFAKLVRWIQTAAWWKLVMVFVATWPLAWIEAFFLEVLTGFIPLIDPVIDGILHSFEESVFLTLPILITVELTRRAWWKIKAVADWFTSWFSKDDSSEP